MGGACACGLQTTEPEPEPEPGEPERQLLGKARHAAAETARRPAFLTQPHPLPLLLCLDWPQGVYQRLAQTIGEDSRFFNPLCCPPQ